MGARYIIGDVFDVLATLEPNSVDLVLTSPPFLALRSYLPSEHPDKGKELGSEATPAAFIDRLLDVVEACDRVLAPHGSIVFELGDTYAGSGGAGGDYGPEGMRGGQEKFNGSGLKDRKNKVLRADGNRLQQGTGWPSEKSLCGIPEAFMLSLAYGRNILRPERQTERWRVRNYVAWCRPNPPVGALGDKFRPGTSYLTVACKAKDRWFDLDAVRSPLAEHTVKYNGGQRPHYGEVGGQGTVKEYSDGMRSNEAGAPPLDWWEIPTEGFAGAHYATFPKRLCDRPILAMCPREVCRTCGEPRRRIVGETTYRPDDAHSSFAFDRRDGERVAAGVNQFANAGANKGCVAERATVGWSDCGHDSYRRGIVLDPFAGSGTALEVAVKHGRDAIGIDLDERNAELARQRCGMFLSVESVSEREES